MSRSLLSDQHEHSGLQLMSRDKGSRDKVYDQPKSPSSRSPGRNCQYLSPIERSCEESTVLSDNASFVNSEVDSTEEDDNDEDDYGRGQTAAGIVNESSENEHSRRGKTAVFRNVALPSDRTLSRRLSTSESFSGKYSK